MQAQLNGIATAAQTFVIDSCEENEDQDVENVVPNDTEQENHKLLSVEKEQLEAARMLVIR